MDSNCTYNSRILKTYGFPHWKKVGWYLDVPKTSCPMLELGMKAHIDVEVRVDPSGLDPRVEWFVIVEEKYMKL